eukprot:CAMPEP_0182839512 /NCGR_PEP_ID=MMETSP0006_2-20121128/23904_1 /TAXON_ID=97485 /ORGANISM="Prymnesium parvum, Strain Texoma1" /LENGTH=82 /DNA_ID=CAMNT_0024968663 /DNA_START=345 /DNA_END=593 /DNA_ORIENTATION=+
MDTPTERQHTAASDGCPRKPLALLQGSSRARRRRLPAPLLRLGASVRLPEELLRVDEAAGAQVLLIDLRPARRVVQLLACLR